MLSPKDKDILLRFLRDWAKPLQELLNQRFGKNKLGHVIITVDTGNNPNVTYTTNLRDADFKRLLRVLGDRVNESRIVH